MTESNRHFDYLLGRLELDEPASQSTAPSARIDVRFIQAALSEMEFDLERKNRLVKNIN